MQLRRKTLRNAAVFVVLAAIAVACGSAATTQGPYDTSVEVRPDLIVVEPARFPAGSTVSVFFPDERTRGVHFVLESQQGDGWNLEYHLISDWGGGRIPTSHNAGSADFAVEDIGFSGPGPDMLSIPAEAPPGDYRVCTGNARPNICALVTLEPGT